MQLTRVPNRIALAIGACAACAAPAAAFPSFDDQVVEGLMQYFNDSQHVSVRSAIGDYTFALPQNRTLTLHWNNEKVNVPAVDAPPGTQEAVDAITTASRPISGNAFQDFSKVRNELEGEYSTGRLSAQYYLSSEKDYLGQLVGASWNRDLDDQLNLSVGASYGWDAIDPVQDDDTNAGKDHKTTLHWNVVATRIVTPTLQARVGVEMNLVNGLQHNPYRNVYAGGTHAPERHPDARQRRDAFLKLNQYLGNRSSVKLHYRFYNDDWGVLSNEVGTTLSQYITHGVFASYDYRWYSQNAADFYRDEYTDVNGIDGYRSGDYRLSDLSSHLFGVALDMDFSTLEVKTPVLGRMGVRAAYERYFNSNNYSANILTTQLTYHF